MRENYFENQRKVHELLKKGNLTPDERNFIQSSGVFHPYTCGNNRTDAAHAEYQKEHGGDFGQLVATDTGWICPVCGYTQGYR